ncbi:hypothetical protein DFH08DRAFT_797027 [Mycena albidolilacea]|uniref:Uncharacterized protein n=1 Tax=Mycena albidolilacea TaxID=1033008 RepID=A0AAD7F259_9AGAR|nr:hypothetical protein DFH08DRAFT_797027 [Mycena albidolilacea]
MPSASLSREDGIIDLVGALDESAWIGRKKKWPANPPVFRSIRMVTRHTAKNLRKFSRASRDYPSVAGGSNSLRGTGYERVNSILAPRFPISLATSVCEFVKIDLPNPTSDFVTGNPKLWFSRDTPLTDVRIVLDRPIPSRELVTRLIAEKCVGQFWLDGCCSFVDPRFNEGKDRFPL